MEVFKTWKLKSHPFLCVDKCNINWFDNERLGNVLRKEFRRTSHIRLVSMKYSVITTISRWCFGFKRFKRCYGFQITSCLHEFHDNLDFFVTINWDLNCFLNDSELCHVSFSYNVMIVSHARWSKHSVN